MFRPALRHRALHGGLARLLGPLCLSAFAATTGATTLGCGYTKEEYALQADKLTRAIAKQRAAETRSDEIAAEAEVAKERVVALEERMRSLGLDLTKETRIGDMAASLAERERALAEFRARAAKVEETRARLSLLRVKLEEVGKLGVEVRVRKNKMVIVVPGDVLFDGNKDKVKKDGRDALKTIAGVLKNDPVLSARDYQVVGHTDDKAAKDSILASLMRARAVRSMLVDPETGGLPKDHVSAAGYGESDGLMPNEDDEARKRNRRVEIVVVPTANEMLDLRALGGEPPAPLMPKPSPTPPPTIK